MRHAIVPSSWFALWPQRGWGAEFWIAVAHEVESKLVDPSDHAAVLRVIKNLEASKELAKLVEQAKDFYKIT